MNGYHLVLLTALVSGFSVFINALGVQGFDPSLFTTLKNACVAAALVALFYLAGNHKKLLALSKGDWAKLFAIGVTGGSVPFLLFFWGLKASNAATAAFVHKTMFVWVCLLAFAFLNERLTRKQLVGAVALLAGTFVFAAPALQLGLGELAVLAATLLWSIETVISKKALSNIAPGIVAAARMGFGLVVLVPFLAATGSLASVLTITTVQWQWVSVTAVLLLGYVWTWYHGLAKVKASAATAVLMLGSVITSILSWAFLAKGMQPVAVVGALVMIAGAIALANIQFPVEVFRRVHGVPSESPVKK